MRFKSVLFGVTIVAALAGVFALPAAAQADNFTCSASALRVNVANVLVSEPTTANAANDPCADDSDTLAMVNVPEAVLTATALEANTDNETDGATSDAQILTASALAGAVTADVLSSSAEVTCTPGIPFHPGNPEFSGDSTVTNLNAGPLAVPVNGSVNQVIVDLPGGLLKVVANEQIVTATSITVRALHVTSTVPIVGTTTDIVFAESVADVNGNPCPIVEPPKPQCSDGIDNDGDGQIDFPADGGCTSGSDNDETGGGPPPPKPQCSDGIDNDGDGLVDFGTIQFHNETPATGCDNAADNSEALGGPPQCSDGIDNDGDGLKDFNTNPFHPGDPQCTSASDTSESS